MPEDALLGADIGVPNVGVLPHLHQQNHRPRAGVRKNSPLDLSRFIR